MLPTILSLAFGAGFVLLGRWVYRNPSKLFPTWGIFNRENPGVQKVGRGYATFVIFIGMFASVGTICALLLPRSSVVVFLGLPVAVVGTWLLRPRVPQFPTGPIDRSFGGATNTAKKQSLLSDHWKRNLGIGIGLMFLFLAGGIAVFTESAVSKMAFAAAQANPVVKRRLGEPVERRFFTSGSIRVSGPTGQADIVIPISGPKGKATVYARALKSAGLWRLETLQVSFGERGEREDLLEQTVGSAQQ